MISRLLALALVAGVFCSDVLAQTAADTTIFRVTEEAPRFPGCEHPDSSLIARKKCADQRLLEYVYRRVIYPVEARDQNIQGTAVISFVVEADGSLSQPKVLRDIGGGTGEAALRLVYAMQQEGIRWIPGKQGGKAVRTQFSLPVKFKLEQPLPYTLSERGDTIYVEYEQALGFKGGGEALQSYLANRLKYPSQGNDSCRMGQIDIQLLVKPDNRVRIINLVDYNNLGFDYWYEAIDAATSTAGSWVPARYQGRAVGSALDVSLSFSPTSAACKQAVERYDQAFVLAEEGAALVDESKIEEGLAKMSEALLMQPTDGKLLLLRGQTYLDANRIEEACKDLQLARRITLVNWYNGVLQLCR